MQEVGQKIKEALHAQNAAPVIVELDWKESVLHEDDRQAPPSTQPADLCGPHSKALASMHYCLKP